MAIIIKKKPPEMLKVYLFGAVNDGSAADKFLLGGKGANLAEMSSLGVSVPPGFTIPCSASVRYQAVKDTPQKFSFMVTVSDTITPALDSLEQQLGYVPLVSVRSGARVSMPGMMDTILNVGLTSETLEHWKGVLGDRAALDSYRRLIQMYSSVALGVPLDLFEHALEDIKKDAGVVADADLTPDHLTRLIKRYKSILELHQVTFPDTVQGQLIGAITAVFESWNNPRAIEYRKIHGYSDSWGTAVTVQAMVFGNLNDQSATGVVFTRCPSTGSPYPVGEYLINAQGEDVVAGIRTPEPILTLGDWDANVASELSDTLSKLEQHYKDMQDVEFTVENGTLYILQTRNGKRSPEAAFRVACDLALDGVITKEQAISRVNQAQLFSVMQDKIDPKFAVKPNSVGIAAGGSVVTGVAVFTSEDAVNCTEPCILVRKETDPNDIAGMNASVGILTATGGLTSHAAVVARGMNKTCVVGCTDLEIQGNLGGFKGTMAFKQGDKLTIDGATGNVWVETEVPVIPGGQSQYVRTILGWAMALAGHVTDRLGLTYRDSTETMIDVVSSAMVPSIYIDTALLEGHWGAIHDMGTALCNFQGSEIVVDMTNLKELLPASDRLYSMISGSEAKPTVLTEYKCKYILQWPAEVLSKVVVRVSDDSKEARATLVKAGVRVIGAIGTVADLLSCGGPVEVSDEVILKVFGSKEAYELVVAAIEDQTGKKIGGTPPKPTYWYNVLSEEA